MRRKAIFLFSIMVLSLALVFPASAATTVVAGDVSGVWDAAGSPYLVEGDITIPAGQSLTIEPGVEVIFQSWYQLTVNGALFAEGSQAAPILFTGSHATAGWLGIRFIGASDDSRLTHVIVEKGRATGASPLDSGGGIYIENSSPTISYSIIRDNYAKRNGGGLYLSGSNARLVGNTVANNRAGSGAGLYLSYSDAELSGNSILNNSIYLASSFSTPYGLGAGLFANFSNPVLRNNLIAGNLISLSGSGYARGGGLYLSSSNSNLINNTIAANSVGSGGGDYTFREGGGIYVTLGSLTLVNDILWNDGQQEVFVNNGTYTTINVGYSDIQDGQAGVVLDGATVNNLGGNLDADPLFVDVSTSNYSLQAGSPAIDAAAAYLEYQGSVLVDLAPGDYIGAAPDMGAFEFGGAGGLNQPPVAVASASPDHGSAPLTVQFNSDGSSDPDGFIAAYAWDFGDGSSSTEANPTHTYNDVATYQATLTVSDDDGASHSAVISVDVVNGTTILAGDVSGVWTLAGSPYRIEGDISVPAGQSLSIEPGVEVNFQSWYQFIVNGTLLAEGSQAEPILFTGSHPTAGWLGIRFIGASDNSRLTHVIVEKGRATGASPLDSGGGIYIENSSPTISYSTIRDNYAKRDGGGLYLSGSNARLIGNVIANNEGGDGAGLYLTHSDAELSGNSILNNSIYLASSFSTPYGLGAGVFADSSSPVLRYNLIAGNYISLSGSGYARGGGLYLSSSNTDLINNTITANTVGTGGGDYTFREGGGIYVTLGSLTLVNDILWNDGQQEIFVNNGAYTTINVAYSDVQDGQAGIVHDGASINWLTGNLNADPLFVDAANGDYNLQAGSPAIDAATAHFEYQGRVLVDLAPGDYLGAAPDMGAFESIHAGTSNLPPTAVASATPTGGYAPLDVQFSADGSNDADGTIVSYAWDFGNGDTSSEANPLYSYNTPGVYQVLLTVSDDRGATGSAGLTITVDDPALDEIHVQAQSVTVSKYSRRWSRATDQVLVTDQNNQPVAGVLVSANYSGTNQGQASAMTDSNGIATLFTNIAPTRNGSWCFEVTSLTKDGYVYNPAANVITTQCN